jgi:hypothetical protein
VPAAPELISEAVNMVISIRRNSVGRMIDEVAEVIIGQVPQVLS